MIPADLPVEWLKLADQQDQLGAQAQASTLRYCAEQLESGLKAEATTLLNLQEAAAESGYSYSSIQKRVASGEIPNVGQPGAPRVRRKDLPRKAPTRPFKLESGEPDLAEEILVGKL